MEASSLQEFLKHLEDGVYYGYAKVVGGDGQTEPMVMSVGQNVTFDATAKTAVRTIPQALPYSLRSHFKKEHVFNRLVRLDTGSAHLEDVCE